MNTDVAFELINDLKSLKEKVEGEVAFERRCLLFLVKSRVYMSKTAAMAKIDIIDDPGDCTKEPEVMFSSL